MKKFTTLLLVIVFATTVLGQTVTETIKKANDLVENKKYETAFKLLQDFDSKNENPDIVLLKEDIALKYFVTSIMHEIFAFKDLEKNEDIMDYRGKEGSFGIYAFSIDSSLQNLIKIYPDNYKLYKGLGDFYYDTQKRYQGRWLKDDSIVSDLIEKNYQVVINHNLADFNIYYTVGLELLTQKKHKESIPYFLKSIELKRDFGDAHYNLAYAYLFNEDRENALKYAKNSLDLYKGKEYKGDAARMIAEIYSELKDDQNAIKYYELANTSDADNYYTLKPLLAIYIKTGNSKAKETLNSFYNLAPDKPTIYNDLGDVYFHYNKTSDLINFYKSKLPDYKDDKKVLGNLYFYLGRLYLDIDKKTAKEYWILAKDVFTTIYDKDNKVFQAIDEGLKETE